MYSEILFCTVFITDESSHERDSLQILVSFDSKRIHSVDHLSTVPLLVFTLTFSLLYCTTKSGNFELLWEHTRRFTLWNAPIVDL